MYEEEFTIRLAKLRNNKGVSARDMSLSLGQNPGYINNIETGKALPSMSVFFFICEYLGVSPQEFFDIDTNHPTELNDLISNVKLLDEEQFNNISGIIRALVSHT
ncbi:MAG: helix-turn-helix domain-containing protein [Lachnospiraceae bacterium]|nr:helix-turn-helix domain-containing protein [Lachnospiraceae bacterium]